MTAFGYLPAVLAEDYWMSRAEANSDPWLCSFASEGTAMAGSISDEDLALMQGRRTVVDPEAPF